MGQPATALPSNVIENLPNTRAELREKLQAHLTWCSFLAGSVEHESMEDLAKMLKETSVTMRQMAEFAEHHRRG
jgi:hypothetical protein